MEEVVLTEEINPISVVGVSELSEKLDSVIAGQKAIHDLLSIILTGAVVAVAFKIVWTIISKWFFGGV